MFYILLYYIYYMLYTVYNFALIFSCKFFSIIFGKLKVQKSYVKNAMGSPLANRLFPFLYYGQKQFTTMNPHISLEKVS